MIHKIHGIDKHCELIVLDSQDADNHSTDGSLCGGTEGPDEDMHHSKVLRASAFSQRINSETAWT